MPADLSGPSVAALIVVRNGAGTLGRLLDSLAAEAVPAVVVDNGSTDGTWEVALSRRREPVRELLREPFGGVFDLTRQLRLKREIIGSLREEWILNLDADELLEPPDNGDSLRGFIARQHAAGATAIDCHEFVFLPEREEEAHAPGDFVETMQRYVLFRPVNPKQRAFRREAGLARWMATGGHTVASGAAPERLNLAHYIGLSLDHIRAQYLPRVFAAGDLARGWHGTRRPHGAGFVVPPPAGALRNRREVGLSVDRPVTRLPIFAATAGEYRAPRPAAAVAAGLVIASACARSAAEVADRVAALRPALVLAIVDPGDIVAAPDTAQLHVLRDGRAAGSAGAGSPREAAAAWCSGVARIRQGALGSRRYREIRLEDLVAGCDVLGPALAALAEAAAPLAAFPDHRPERTGAPLPAAAYLAAFEAVAAPLLRDLGYGRA